MGFRPTKGNEGPLADARGSAWDAHCKQSRDRKGALEVWTFNGADFGCRQGSNEIPRTAKIDGRLQKF